MQVDELDRDCLSLLVFCWLPPHFCVLPFFTVIEDNLCERFFLDELHFRH